ncbi:MAG: hypothetical protein R3D29_11115 [Nitratireductor sp.]
MANELVNIAQASGLMMRLSSPMTTEFSSDDPQARSQLLTLYILHETKGACDNSFENTSAVRSGEVWRPMVGQSKSISTSVACSVMGKEFTPGRTHVDTYRLEDLDIAAPDRQRCEPTTSNGRDMIPELPSRTKTSLLVDFDDDIVDIETMAFLIECSTVAMKTLRGSPRTVHKSVIWWRRWLPGYRDLRRCAACYIERMPVFASGWQKGH